MNDQNQIYFIEKTLMKKWKKILWHISLDGRRAILMELPLK